MPRIDAILSKTMKKTDIVKTARDVIHNKYVLYAVFVAALFDLLYSAVKEDFLYCILFILIGFLIAFFNKNMTVILTLTMAFATILRNVIRGNVLKLEGMKDSEEEEEEEEEDEDVSESFTPTTSASKGQPDKLPVIETESSEKKLPSATTPSATTPSVTKPSATTPSATTPSSTTSSAKLMGELKDKAIDLQDAQQHIIKGFEKIEPYMDKAESLIQSIQTTAQTIQGMRAQQQAFQSGR